MKKIYILTFIVIFISACASFRNFFNLSDDPPIVARSGFPSRSFSAPTGSKFIEMTISMNEDARDRAIYAEINKGNIPPFLRKPKAVYLKQWIDKKKVSATVWVLPDYLAIGSDVDFVRIPMTPMAAQKLADRFGYALPTRKLVNEIYRQAGIKLAPSPMKPGPKMTSSAYYLQHEKTIERQMRGKRINQIVAGHKKDLVLTNLLEARPYRVAIFGWHTSISKPIQPLSLVHGNTYADYSHGIRFVLSVMQVGAQNLFYSNVLKDKKLSSLVSDEGPIMRTRVRTTPGPGKNWSLSSSIFGPIPNES